jgi:hypothetical protein
MTYLQDIHNAQKNELLANEIHWMLIVKTFKRHNHYESLRWIKRQKNPWKKICGRSFRIRKRLSILNKKMKME